MCCRLIEFSSLVVRLVVFSVRKDDSTCHEDEKILPSKGKKKSNMADSSLVKTSALKPSPRERSTEWSKEVRGGDEEGEGDDDGGILPALVVPAVRPPASSKSKLYKTPEIFKDLDRRAVEVMVHKIFQKIFMVFHLACYLSRMSVRYFGSRPLMTVAVELNPNAFLLWMTPFVNTVKLRFTFVLGLYLILM